MKRFWIFLLSSFCLYAINWTEPTAEDFLQLQRNLRTSRYPYITHLRSRNQKAAPRINRIPTYRNATFVRDGEFDKDVRVVSFGDNPEKVAICTYFTYNWRKTGRTVESCVADRIEQLKQHGFTGDFVYQIGGYPNVEEGDLKLYATPYAFKIAMLRRMKRLGYKKVFWLDGVITVKRDLRELFMQLDIKPVCLRDSLWPFAPNCLPHIRETLEITEDELATFKHYSNSIVGFNFTDPRVLKFLDEWYELALLKTPFFCCFPCQIAYSILLQRNELPIDNTSWAIFLNNG